MSNKFNNYKSYLASFFILLGLLAIPSIAFAHGVADADAKFVAANSGFSPIEFLYLGAKHMITGYDHLLFLVGVIFFLYKMKHVALYVTLFTIGHSLTLLFGVLTDISVNAYIIDAIIGLSVVYKGFDNLGGFKKFLGFQPNTKWVVFIFGLFHGFGLATKLQQLNMSPDGLLGNLLAFNVGVELGQLTALAIILFIIIMWRKSSSFLKFSYATNFLLMVAGFVLFGYQLVGYFSS